MAISAGKRTERNVELTHSRFATALTTGLMMAMLMMKTESGGPAGRRGQRASHARPTPCPVDDLQYNGTGPDGPRCVCVPSGDIRCHGGIQSIPKLVVEHLRHAQSTSFGGFYAARQEVSGIPAFTFADLSLNRIILNFNPLGHRDGLDPDAFGGFTLGLTLHELYLGACQLRHIPLPLVRDLVALRRLHLWANEMELLPIGLFNQPGGGGRNLVELSLWGNRIEEIEERTLEGLAHLRVLDLDRNRIYIIDTRAFAAVPKLRCLRLAGNNIGVIYEDTFISVPNLQVLNLDRNGLGYVYTDAFDSVPSLLSLSLSHNVIGFLPDDVFSSLRDLRDLRLAANTLSHVWAGTFAGLSQLTRLDLSGNVLVHLPAGTFRHAPFLRHIRLDDNHLTALDRCSVVAVVPGRRSSTWLRTLSFVGNSAMACDCRLAWIVDLQDAQTRHIGIWGACSGNSLSIIDIVANDTDHCTTFHSDICAD